MSITFCGASVRGFNSSLGWNEQQSTFRCTVIEDPTNGDFFNPPLVGTPVYFFLGSFYFAGLLQKWERTNSTDALPGFEIQCVDPRQILEGAQIITGSYRDEVNIANLYNVFGWWENLTGFGSSLSNDTGMPFYKIQEALLSCINNPQTGSYGGPLQYRGYYYSLDLSELPIPPEYYRVSSPNLSILELINTVCEDGGCDYFVEFIPNTFTIKIRTASRIKTAPLGVISSLQLNGLGVDLIRSSAGIELRNEITSAFVVGGEQQTLNITEGTAITPFWGFDIDGNPIIGTGSGIEHTASLNASAVADIIGDINYNCNIFELRCALDSRESWMAYMSSFKRDLSNSIGLNFGIDTAPAGLNNIIGPDDFMKDDEISVKAANDAFTATLAKSRIERMYAFISDYANDYMGKKFLVAIPFLLNAIEPETLKQIESLSVADAGYLPEGSTPLDMPILVQDQFKNQEGRFEAFVKYDSSLNIDFSKLSGTDLYIGDDGIYVKAQIDQKIVYTPAPAVILTVSNALYEPPIDSFGDLTLVANILGTGPDDIIGLNDSIAGGTGVPAIHPEALQPTQAAIPLKSNILTYGPWYLQGASGKVRFEYDPTLVPWNYGGYEYMQEAGVAKVTNGITFLQEVETGSLEFVGEPLWALGDLIQDNGPNITSIEVGFGQQGITTSYRMTTFSPRFGVFNKDNAKRFERLGRTTAELRKGLRAALNTNIATNAVIGSAIGAAIANTVEPVSMSRKSPHTTLLSTTKIDDSGNSRVSVSSATYAEICSGNGGNKDKIWQNTAVMSMNGLIRPFSISPSGNMSHFTIPDPKFTVGINSQNYNPFQTGNDINAVAKGNSYKAMNQYKTGYDPNTRVMGLRGPLVVTGWGWTIDGNKVPGNEFNGSPQSNYSSNYLKKSHLWKTGEVDLLWDDKRGVWTSHDILIGKTTTVSAGAAISANGSGIMKVYDGTTYTNFNINVYNWFNAGISGDKNIVAGYCVTANKWYVIAADC